MDVNVCKVRLFIYVFNCLSSSATVLKLILTPSSKIRLPLNRQLNGEMP